MKRKRREANAFFSRPDRYAFWVTATLAFIVYVYTLAPTVTLEDSGELAVAADYLGVPHPPGYPIWTMLAWLFQAVFGFVTYHGQPNPAWAVGLMSAVSGAAAVGLLALMVSRSGADLLGSLKPPSHPLICPAAGVLAGLLLAFSPVLWSQSVIVEVYSLNTLFLTAIMVLTYRTLRLPPDNKRLLTLAFVFGLGLTNHHALLFIAPPLLTGLWFYDRRLGRDCLAVLVSAAAVLLVVKARGMGGPPLTPALRLERTVIIGMAVMLAAVPIALFCLERKLLTEWRRVLLLGLFIALGLSFYAYMPIASSRNPPMNWGYSRTWNGFLHSITRGQYEKIRPVANLIATFKDPGLFLRQLHTFVTDPASTSSVVAQFTLPISVLACVPLLFVPGTDRRDRRWLTITGMAFLSFTVLFIVFQKPLLDLQTVFVARVQHIQAHAVFALWLGYGAILVCACLGRQGVPGKWAAAVMACLAVVLPVVPIVRNAVDQELIRTLGGAEQNGHDFGWQFGAGQLRGAAGIRDILPEHEQHTYPDPTYPPPMETNAIFFGGTDPGRFVPTYMIFSAKVRPDVYLITQNALADNTYMSVMRDLYGHEIWIPSETDSAGAFREYVGDVRAGKRSSTNIRIDPTGRIQVQGAGAVMQINGILARMIFEKNKSSHAFYVEESYPIPWMYSYLEPHGLIMKINTEPVSNLSVTCRADDRAFWDWYTARLMGDPKFLRDAVARKTFAKLRSAIAGLYAARGLLPEAEYAFKQALQLHPSNSEASARLASLYVRLHRFAEAGWLIQKQLALDPNNTRATALLVEIEATQALNKRRVAIEKMLRDKKADINQALELIVLYHRLRMARRFDQLVTGMLQDSKLPAQVYPQMAQTFASIRRPDLVCTALTQYLKQEPGNTGGWMDLAAAQAAAHRPEEALASLARAIELGGDRVRRSIRRDKRFTPLQQIAEFQRLAAVNKPGRNSSELTAGLGLPFQQ